MNINLKNHKTMKKSVLIIVLLALISNLGFSGNPSVNNQTQKPKTWTLLFEKSGIQVFYKYADCNDVKNGIFQEMAYLKLVNTTNLNVTLDWDLKRWLNDKCVNCESNNPEHHFSFKLNAGETKSGSCENRFEFRELSVFSKFLNMDNKATLTKFSLENFIVKPL